MMKKKYTISILVLFLALSVCISQEEEYLSYNWDESPKHLISDSDKDSEVIGLKDYSIYEYAFDKDDNFYQYNIIHRVLWLNSDDRIEQFNKIYLPYNSTSELLRSQARVISANGTVQELDESQIFTATDESSNQTIKYYAIEGIEKGGFIEYLYIIKKAPDYKGSYVRLQKDYKIIDSKLEIFSPENLIFKMFSVNSDQEAESDESVKGKQHLVMRKENLPKLEGEELSAVEAMKEAVIFKLFKNTATGGSSFGSFNEISKNIFAYVFSELKKSEKSELAKFLKKANIDKKDDDASKIRTLENYIKNTIYITESGGDQFSNIAFVLENKTANGAGAVRLFANALQELEIPLEIVLTCDRSEIKFDKDIEAVSFLQEYLLYFPTTKQYLAPTKQETRYGYPPFEYTDTYGLFVQKVELGELRSGVGKVKYIKSPDAAASMDEMNYKVSFDPEDLTEVHIDFDRAIGGYNASFIHPFMNLISPDDKEEFYNEFIKSMGDEVTIQSKEILNEAPDNYGVKPLRIKAQLVANGFMNKAGPKYLFKLGDLIGPQIEMYQEKERQLPIENLFRKTYLRRIEIEIPDGFVIKNLDDINISHSFKADGKDMMYFVSSYTREGNKVIVTANEIYDKNILPVEQYEEYRTVINGAADFNKVTLILEAKN